MSRCYSMPMLGNILIKIQQTPPFLIQYYFFIQLYPQLKWFYNFYFCLGLINVMEIHFLIQQYIFSKLKASFTFNILFLLLQFCNIRFDNVLQFHMFKSILFFWQIIFISYNIHISFLFTSIKNKRNKKSHYY